MDTLQDIRQVFEGSPNVKGYFSGISSAFVQAALEIRKQMPDVLDHYYLVIADVDTGHSLILNDLPRMTKWLRSAPQEDLRGHVQQNLALLRTSSHMKMMNYDSYRLYLYRRQLLDFISQTMCWSLEKVPKRIAKRVKKMYPHLCQPQNKTDYDSSPDLMTLYSCMSEPKEMFSKDECYQCGVKKEKMQKCSMCHKARYCSKECQTLHWKSSHKDECQDLQGLHVIIEDDLEKRKQFALAFQGKKHFS